MFRENKHSEKQRFSIKKYSFGVTSALVGVFLAAGSNSAQAADEPPVQAVATASQPTSESKTYVLKNNNVVDVTQEPRVETKEVQATTEYVADETKDYGTKVVEKEAKNGNITTTKSYEVVKEEVKEAKEWPKVEVEYTVDNTKELPSDRVVLSENKNLRFDSSNYTSDVEMVDLLLKIGGYIEDEPKTPVGREIIFPKLSSGRYTDEFISNDTLSSQDEAERYYTNHAISDELYAISKLEIESIKKVFEEKNAELRKEYEGRLTYDDETGKWMIKRVQKDGVMVEVAKSFDEFKEDIFKNFETVTRNYNNSRGDLGVSIDHTKSGLSDAERKEFDEKVKGLPVELFRNINTLVLTTEELIERADVRGLSWGDRREIQIRTNFEEGKFDGKKFVGWTESVIVESIDGSQQVKLVPKSPHAHTVQDVMETLLHELAHNIDSMAGNTVYDNTVNMGSFSTTEEFRKIYTDFFEGKVVGPYYKNAIIEAFAESFSYYVMARLEKENPSLYAGLYKPKGYIKRDIADERSKEGEGIVDIISGDTVNVERNGKTEKVSSDKYKDEAYYPFEKTFAYFDDLFAKLGLWSKTPIGYKIVEKEETTSKTAENGRVLVGTKPKEEITTKVEDNLLLTDVTKTSYSVNSGTGEVTPHVNTLVKAKLNENLVVNEFPKLDETLFVIPPKVETSKGAGLKLEDKPALDEILVKPVVMPTPVVEISKGDVLVQEEKPVLDETLFEVVPKSETSKGESVTETKPELHLISTQDGSVQAKPNALVQEEKLVLQLDGTKVPAKSDKRTIKTKTGATVLPKTSATESNSTLPVGLAGVLVAAGLMTAKRRKN